jgi:hypothetical protein
MSSQKAHWYNIIAPSKSDPLSNDINRIFSTLSSLLNIDATIMNRVLEKSSLCHRRGEVLFPVVQAWHDFITEYGIDVELTMFSIGSKRHYFLRIGSYNRSSHPAKMLIFYWRELFSSQAAYKQVGYHICTACWSGAVNLSSKGLC